MEIFSQMSNSAPANSKANANAQPDLPQVDDHQELSLLLEQRLLENDLETANNLLSIALSKAPHHFMLRVWYFYGSIC